MTAVIAVRAPLVLPTGPQAMWDGFQSTDMVMFSWWPPPSQTDWGIVPGQNGAPDYYNIYRDGVKINLAFGAPLWGTNTPTNPGITAESSAYGLGGQRTVPWFIDKVTPSATPTPHVYTVTANSGGFEGPPGPPLTMTALATGGSASPAAPIDPATWIQAYALPTGGTTWTCTNTASTAVTGTGTFGQTGCSLGWALGSDRGYVPRANINGGDIIVLTAGANYPVPPGDSNGYSIPNFTGTNGWTYIISSQADSTLPGYNGANQTLPAFPTNTALPGWTAVNCTAVIPTTASTATLAPNQTGITDASGNWLLKTGYYYVLFTEPTWQSPGGVEGTQQERRVKFTNGSPTIDWSTLNPQLGTLVAAGFQGNPTGLLAAQANATIQVNYLAGVTPYDIPAMPTIQFATLANQNGLTFINSNTATCNKVRFVGINVAPFDSTSGGLSGTSSYLKTNNINAADQNVLPCESIYLDRCCIGKDEANLSKWVGITHGLGGWTVNHFYVPGSYFYGIGNNLLVATSDSNLNILGGGPMCWENTYISCCSESVIHGGAYVPRPPNMPHDIVFRYVVSHKPRAWDIGENSQVLGISAVGSISNGAGAAGNTLNITSAPGAGQGIFAVGSTITMAGLPGNVTITALGTGTGGVGTYTVSGSPVLLPATGTAKVAAVNYSLPWGMYGGLAKNHIEFKAGQKIEIHHTMCLNNWEGQLGGYSQAAFGLGAVDQTPTGTITTSNLLACPWIKTTDVNLHDLLLYCVGAPFWTFTPGYTNPSNYSARITVKNVQVYINPLNSTQVFSKWVTGFNFNGAVADILVDGYTAICNMKNTVMQSPNQHMRAASWVSGGTGPGTYINPPPKAPTGIDLWNDRLTIRNSILGTGGSDGTTPLAFNFSTYAGKALGTFPNLTMAANITIGDTTVYQGTNTTLQTYAPGTINNIAYANMGFKAFVNDTMIPLHPSDWNIISGPYATGSTTGGPIGATF